MMRAILLLLIASTTLAHADPKAAIVKKLELLPPMPEGGEHPDADRSPADAPRITFGPSYSLISPNMDLATGELAMLSLDAKRPIIGVARDGKSAWIACEVDVQMPLASEADDVPNRGPDGFFHASGVLDGGPTWKWSMWHIGWTGFRKNPRPKLVKDYPKLLDNVEGADEVANVFKASLVSPKQLGATISDRKDAVLLGSARKERFVGGKAMRATLARWKLSFSVRDHVQAQVTSSGTIAWVAAHVDARPAGKPKAKPTPYRASFIYEREGDTWKVVVAQFSTVPASDD